MSGSGLSMIDESLYGVNNFYWLLSTREFK